MILQALNDYYQRLLDGPNSGVSLSGYSNQQISYEILLASDGTVVQVNDIRDMSGKKPRPKLLSVPQSGKTTSGVKPKFLWDKTSYLLGVSNKSKRVDKEHEAFRTLHLEQLAGTEDAGLKALLNFIQRWKPEHFVKPHFEPEMLDTNVVFRLDGEMAYIHERPAAQYLWSKQKNDENSDVGLCLVTGQHLPLARLHPAIKGFESVQPSGVNIVSFNKDAFLSYGGSLKKLRSKRKNNDSSACAPISRQAAFGYTTALSYLLRRGKHNRHRIQIGDIAVVFWAETADSDNFLAEILNMPASEEQETGRFRNALEKVSLGLPLSELDVGLEASTRIFVLGLSPNNSRLSIRFWSTQRLDEFVQHLAQHYADLRLEPLPWGTPPPIWRLLLATAPSRKGKSKSEDVPPQLAGELTRAILTGGRYPRSLLANIIMRLRADGDISGVRVALCKGVLARERRLDNTLNKEELPVSLDTTNTNPGYLLGRLFSTLENVQHAALGKNVNATIRDRYYGAASATPASIFPVLLRSAQHHLSRVRKDKPGFAVNLEKELGQIIDQMDSQFPRSLRIEAQGQFAIGYYHQNEARYASKNGPDTTKPESEEGVDA